MDIFQFAGYASLFTSELWVCLLVGFLCFIIVYIFQGMGLTVIAKHEGYGHRWMAWVPFLQLYYIGVCAQKNKVMNSFNTKGFAIAAVIFDISLFIGYTLYYVSYFLVEKYIVWEPYYIGETYVYDVFGGFNTAVLPSSLKWAAWVYEYSYDYILQWLELIFIILKLFLFTSFYRTYSSRRYVLFSIVGSLTPFNGIIIYVVRNNKGLNYNDYLRKVREENYRRYQQQQQQNMYNQNPYNNPYNQNPYNQNPYGQNPYDNNQQQQQQNTAPDPFDEFSGNNNYGNNTDSANGNTNGNINAGGNNTDDSPFEDF